MYIVSLHMSPFVASTDMSYMYWPCFSDSKVANDICMSTSPSQILTWSSSKLLRYWRNCFFLLLATKILCCTFEFQPKAKTIGDLLKIILIWGFSSLKNKKKKVQVQSFGSWFSGDSNVLRNCVCLTMGANLSKKESLRWEIIILSLFSPLR